MGPIIIYATIYRTVLCMHVLFVAALNLFLLASPLFRARPVLLMLLFNSSAIAMVYMHSAKAHLEKEARFFNYLLAPPALRFRLRFSFSMCCYLLHVANGLIYFLLIGFPPIWVCGLSFALVLGYNGLQAWDPGGTLNLVLFVAAQIALCYFSFVQ